MLLALAGLLGQSCGRSGKTIDDEVARGGEASAGTAVADEAEAARSHIDALQKLANPWSDAAGGLSLLREGASARPLTLVSLSVETTPQRQHAESAHKHADSFDVAWRAEYRLTPHSHGRDDSDVDAALVVVEERGGRRVTSDEVRVDRKYLVRGLAAGRTIVLDVPLETVLGDRLELSLHGAEVRPEIGTTQAVIELARDESTALELRLRTAITR